MLEEAQKGFRDAVREILEGIIVSALVGVLGQIPFLPSDYMGMIQLFEAVYLMAGILVVLVMESWGFCYLLGWLLGMSIMSIINLVEHWFICSLYFCWVSRLNNQSFK